MTAETGGDRRRQAETGGDWPISHQGDGSELGMDPQFPGASGADPRIESAGVPRDIAAH